MADNTGQEPMATTTAAIDRITLRPDKAHEQRTSSLHPILDLPQWLAREQVHAPTVANGRTSDPAIAPFDALATPVIHTDLFGIVTGWNRAAETLFGYSAREVIGRRLATIPPEEEERFAHFRQRALIGETITNVAVEQIHKQGHRVSVLLSAAPWYADGEVVGVATSLTDLSTQKSREWELVALAGAETRRARDAVYIAAVADACVAEDERAILDALVGCTAEWSDSAGAVTTGEGSGELVAYASAVRDADGPVAALFEACAMHWMGGPDQGTHARTAPRVYRLREVPIGGVTTAQRYHTLASAPIVVEGENVATLYAAARGARAPLDETSAATLANAAAHAGRAIARARALATLKTRLDTLEAANRHKDDFLATVSHELRTPLTAILGFAHIIVENDALGPARRRSMAEDIVASGGLLLTQVNDLLDIVQLGAGRLTVSPETVNLVAVIAWCERAVRALMHSKNLQFALDIPADLPPAHANTARLQQVLLNFLVNAYKFTPSGGMVTLEARAINGAVAISVRDTGIGIAPEHAARIFEPFARVETEYTRTQSGAGVGLAVARQLVDLMDGTIILNSTPDVGSTFTVSLKTVAGVG